MDRWLKIEGQMDEVADGQMNQSMKKVIVEKRNKERSKKKKESKKRKKAKKPQKQEN